METQVQDSTTRTRSHSPKGEVFRGQYNQQWDTLAFDLKPAARSVNERGDLSFVGWIFRDEFHVTDNWLPARLPPQVGQWAQEYMMGKAMLEEVMALQGIDEAAAFEAMKFAVSSPNWQTGGSGVESGFFDSIAALAIVGMRALAEGKPLYQHV
ncbi:MULTISPECIES: hypothetical protein [unclassified Marinobacter]|uniref:hypothetical protein n=1 Tax=unclassified Marinobacter TaxID=83889 RepID=UPI00192657A6|nr:MULTISPECIES: hypothetical protein [unclassified Marinobacter]MBL3825183.1 hypothetical protein [Marinobacter sp. MC3]MBL3893613.1 hypothetical protein [Marinobacter sp. MW3]